MIALLVPLLLVDSTRVCRPAPFPKHLPAVNEVVDSAALQRFFNGVSLAPPRHVLLSLGFELDGAARRNQVMESDVGLDSAVTIGRYVVGILRQQAETEQPWAVRLRIVMADTARFTLEPSRYCPPVLESRNYGRPIEVRVHEPLQHRHIATVTVKLVVADDGSVLSATLIQSSGIQGMDDALVDWTRQYHFLPALLDDVAVQSVFESRATFR